MKAISINCKYTYYLYSLYNLDNDNLKSEHAYNFSFCCFSSEPLIDTLY